MNDALQLAITSDKRVDLALQGKCVKVDGIAFQWPGRCLRLGFGFAFGFALCSALWHLADAVGNEVDHVKTGYSLFLQVVNGVRILLAKNGNEHIGTIDLFFARGLNVQNRALNDALETECWLRIDVFFTVNHWRVFNDELCQVFSQLLNVSAASTQCLGCGRVVQ